MHVRSVFSILLIYSFSVGFGQSSQSEYLEAKRQFSLGNFSAAKQAFQSLTNDLIFGEYASFYYALSSFRLGQKHQAEDMWKQMQVKYPNWEQSREVDFWLAYLSFDQKKWWEAFRRAESLPEDWKLYLIDVFLGKMSLSELDSAYALNPNNKYIATYYAQAIQEAPYAQQNQWMLRELTEKFDLNLGEARSLPLIKKDEYAVAVVLPFMFESLATPQTVMRNSIIFDLYQGMDMAQQELRDLGIRLNLFPFDTQKNGSIAYDLIQSNKLEKADLIIGPLYQGPLQFFNQFSKEKKITMINPLSGNGKVVEDNPYGYLFKPAYGTQGREAARFASTKFTANKKVFIFYETDRDSIVAHAYRQVIEKDSFFVVRFERLSSEDAQQIQKDFTEQYEVRIDTMYTQSQIDSIANIPGRIVRTRSLRNEQSGRIIRDDEGHEVIETYEVKFTVKPDSIGHIFAATSSNLLANNFISMVEVRSDSIGIIGYDDWLDFSLVSYPQLERLQVNFISPSFYDQRSDIYQDLRKRFIAKHAKEPSEYNVYGYELMMQLGKAMDAYGKYPQIGWSGGSFFPGYIMEGLKYGIYRDNQIVPITTLQNFELKNLINIDQSGEPNEDSNE